jgi:hypothetical protein
MPGAITRFNTSLSPLSDTVICSERSLSQSSGKPVTTLLKVSTQPGALKYFLLSSSDLTMVSKFEFQVLDSATIPYCRCAWRNANKSVNSCCVRLVSNPSGMRETVEGSIDAI